MAKATYEQAYATLKSAWWDDDKIKTNLAKKWLYPDKGWGWADLWWPDNNSPINDIEVPDTYNNVDIDYTDPKWEEKLWEIGDTAVPDKNDDSDEANWPELLTPANGVRWAVIMEETLRQWVAKPILNWVSKQWWAKAALKVLWTKIPKLGTWLAEHAPTANQAMAIINWLISGYQNSVDRKNWILKAEYWVNWNYSSEAYWNDFLRNMVGYWDEYFAKLPSQLLKMAWKEWLNDYLYNTNSEDIKNQKEDLDKNKEIKDTYKKLWWNWWDNFWWTDWFEWWYLKEEKNIKKKYWGDWAMMAEQQLTRAAVDLWLQNDADFKKQIIDDWYKFWMVKDKNWNTTKTWYKKTTWSDGKTKYVTLTNEVKNIRSKAWKESKTNEKKK